MLSNNQIDKLGAKLKDGIIDATCLRDLEAFRQLFGKSYEVVENVLVDKLSMKVTGRPSKSTVAIVDKLRRETIRLSQIQDIAGCRVLVPNLSKQDDLVETLQVLLPEIDIDDKRARPTHGYRAVHVISRSFGRPVEIQVRTHLQHAWAELSEKVADRFGHSVKYGIGDADAVEFLRRLSIETNELERIRHLLLVARSEKAMRGMSRELHRRTKDLNEHERKSMRRIRAILDPKV